MSKDYRRGAFFAAVLLSASAGFTQEGGSVSIPEVIRRPLRVDTPQRPFDIVIGELGRGELSAEHLRYGEGVLRALMQGREQSPLFETLPEGAAREIIERIALIRAHKFRIGGGKEVADGAYSFLFRFIGPDGQAGGAIYFIRGEDGFALDDIMLDDLPEYLFRDDTARLYHSFPYEQLY
jgi:hypothetical protein